jgi:hypothetical protein
MYRVTLGLEATHVSDRAARALYDLMPEDLRTGDREGSFIIWQRDAKGFRTMPMIFKPVGSGAAMAAARA